MYIYICPQDDKAEVVIEALNPPRGREKTKYIAFLAYQWSSTIKFYVKFKSIQYTRSFNTEALQCIRDLKDRK